jgi:hypothetical protein
MAVPDATPATIPELDPTVAIEVLLLTHDPPVKVFPNVIVAPVQTVVGPVIGPGAGIIFTEVVTKQLPPVA